MDQNFVAQGEVPLDETKDDFTVKEQHIVFKTQGGKLHKGSLVHIECTVSKRYLRILGTGDRTERSPKIKYCRHWDEDKPEWDPRWITEISRSIEWRWDSAIEDLLQWEKLPGETTLPAICDILKNRLKNEADKNTLNVERVRETKEKMNLLEQQLERSRQELLEFRIQAAKLTSGTKGKSTYNDLPSIVDIPDMYANFWEEANEVYGDFVDDREKQRVFATAMMKVTHGLYVQMRDSYKQKLECVLEAFDNMESIGNTSRATDDMFYIYCKTHWRNMFWKLTDELDHRFPVTSRGQPPYAISGQEEGALDPAAQNDGLSDNQSKSNTLETQGQSQQPNANQGFAAGQTPSYEEGPPSHPPPVTSGSQQGAPDAAAQNDAIPDNQSKSNTQETQGQTRGLFEGKQEKSPREVQLHALQELLDEYVDKLVCGDVDSERLVRLFESLWELTVVMFLQQPFMRFFLPSNSTNLVVSYDEGMHHDYFLPMKKGSKAHVIVPCIITAPSGTARYDKCFPETSEEWGKISGVPKGWVLFEKAKVDALY